MSLLSGLLSKKKKRYDQSYSQQYPLQPWEYGDYLPFQYAQPNNSYLAADNYYRPGHYNANTPQPDNNPNRYAGDFQSSYQQPIQATTTSNQSYSRNNPYLPYQMDNYSPQADGNHPYQEPYNPYVQHPYYQGNTPPAMPVSAGYPPPQPYGYHQQQIGNQAHYQVNPFQNPLYHQDEDFGPVQTQQQAGMYPYPKQNISQKSNQIGVTSIVNQFKTQDGSLDYTKMMDTAGQMMSAVNQVSTLVKGFGGFFKTSV